MLKNARVKVIAARNLKAADHGGTSDPYVTISLGKHIEAKHAPHKTRTVKKTINPVWEEVTPPLSF